MEEHQGTSHSEKGERTEYAIDIIPNKEKHTKVIIDAQTGAVLSSKQFGRLRGVAGWVRESAERGRSLTCGVSAADPVKVLLAE